MFAADSLRAIKVPVQLWASERDGDGVTPHMVAAVDSDLRVKHEYQVIPNSGHFAFLAPRPPALVKTRPELCADAPGLARSLSPAVRRCSAYRRMGRIASKMVIPTVADIRSRLLAIELVNELFADPVNGATPTPDHSGGYRGRGADWRLMWRRLLFSKFHPPDSP